MHGNHIDLYYIDFIMTYAWCKLHICVKVLTKSIYDCYISTNYARIQEEVKYQEEGSMSYKDPKDAQSVGFIWHKSRLLGYVTYLIYF